MGSLLVHGAQPTPTAVATLLLWGSYRCRGFLRRRCRGRAAVRGRDEGEDGEPEEDEGGCEDTLSARTPGSVIKSCPGRLSGNKLDSPDSGIVPVSQKLERKIIRLVFPEKLEGIKVEASRT